ncbi:ATP-binding protein [Hydrogenophaga sp. PAMC20947]|uniref:ATP-binding protein n=1 Tax=Hydrogenophaga sp. PAMC20947 TaxID=2565558 RepID=UPI00109DA5C3|nr:ATP-binding protein [Hydrogenophaga sp. PAMC20947]QCB46846.1 HAMP domain-containing protein [Hydrogenophaga sp. PAMC20947]
MAPPQLAGTLLTLMRARIAYTLSFWLLGAVALSVLSMGGLTAWHLREGFSAYLQTRDLERLDRFTALVTSRLSAQVASDASAPFNAPDMRALLRTLAEEEGSVAKPSDAGQDSPPPDSEGMLPRRPGFSPPEGSGLLPPRSGPPPGSSEAFGSRVALVRPNGDHWVGPRIERDEPGVVERPVRVDGVVRVWVRFRPRQRAPEAQESQFLRTQYTGIAVVASVLLLLALGVAAWLARQWARPLVAVQHATARIAQGELAVRIPVDRSDEIGDVVRNVNTMAESLQRMEGSRRRWLADLSHELRTPLTVLRGELEAMEDGVRPLDLAAVISLKEDVLRLGLLVEDLHLLAMADLQALSCNFAPEDAVQLVQQILKRHERLMEEAGLQLAWVDPAEEAIAVCWDTARMAQLLSNLLHNSLRYTDAPGRVEVRLWASDGVVHIRLDDSAPGVAPADLARLFDPLYRADSARSRHNGGSGLGLAICAAIAKAHGGRITAKPSPLGGMQLQVSLPAQPERSS